MTDEKRPANILSLFDGISCGRLALDRAKVSVGKYYASEIDPKAAKVSEYHWPEIVRLGDVTKWREWDIDWTSIDVIMAGSPCQGFSLAGKQLNFDDPRSKLFFVFVDILRYVKDLNPSVVFLLENVKMKKVFEDVISETLWTKPIKINSALVSAQNRPRYYWTNLKVLMPADRGVYFDQHLYRLGHGYIEDEIKFFRKYPALAAQSPATKYRIVVDLDKAKGSSFSDLRTDVSLSRPATPEECEFFQTLPVGYTACIPKTHRYKAIGNGWTVDVIAHILGNVSEVFKK